MKFKTQLRKIKAKFPTKLPTSGAPEFNAWATSILELYELPTFDSYYHAIATAIMHLSPTTSHAPKAFFAKTVRKAMANQIAYEKISEIREKEKQLSLVKSDTCESG